MTAVNVTLMDYTGHGHPDPARRAATMLIFAKNTRVNMSPNGMEEIDGWPEERRREELEYIANTIPGSWEFVDYTFLFQSTNRGVTHQIVRTRTASYAQQTMQILDVSGFTYDVGDSIEGNSHRSNLYHRAMGEIDLCYRALIEDGAAVQDARGLLPTAIHTNILMKGNLRTMVEFVRTRTGPRNAQDTRVLAEQMRNEMIRVHPWVLLFLASNADDAARQLDELISEEVSDKTTKNLMHKMVDRMRRRS